MTNFCRDCAHQSGQCYDSKMGCEAPQNNTGVTSLVTGELAEKHLLARDCREDILACGPEGKWFQSYQQIYSQAVARESQPRVQVQSRNKITLDKLV